MKRTFRTMRRHHRRRSNGFTRVARTGARFRNPLFELLESRCLLASVTSVDPLANSLVAPIDTNVSAIYDEVVDPASVSAASFVVHGSQTGRVGGFPQLVPPGNAISLTPTSPFHVGELVQVTATAGVQNVAGSAASPYVWQFQTVTSASDALFIDSGQKLGVSSSQAVALGDLDGDGDLDAFVGNDGGTLGRVPNSDEIWLNDGQGHFEDSDQRLGDTNTNDVALEDVDGDGDLDAFTSAMVDDSPRITIWLNDGVGQFSDSGRVIESQVLALGDLDADGDMDIVGPNRVWINNWQTDPAGFTMSPQSLGSGDGIAISDMDGDGDLDVIKGNRLWLNDGMAQFTAGQTIGDRISARNAVGDLDGDGDLDIFRGDRIWLNDGGGNFTADQPIGRSRSDLVVTGDVDGDGDLDAVVENTLWINDGAGKFGDAGRLVGTDSSPDLALGDVDGDGDLDVFAAFVNRQHNRVWLNVDADEVVDLSIKITDGRLNVLPGEQLIYTITANNDGSVDAPAAVVADSFPSILTNVSWTTTASAGSHAAASGTGDIYELVDLAAGGTVTFTVTATVDPAASLPGNAFANSVSVAAPSGLLDRALDNNKAADTNRFGEAGGEPGFAFHVPVALRAPGEYVWTAIGDVNGDTHPDVIVAERESRTVQVSYSDGRGSFDPIGDTSNNFSAGLEPTHVATADIDGDDDLDIIVTGNDVSVLLNLGSSAGGWMGLATPTVYTAGNEASASVLSDFDHDGHLDLAVATSADVQVRLGNGDGTFQDRVFYTLGTGRRAVATADVNGDGDIDLIVGNEESKTLVILLGQGDGTFEQQGTPLLLDQAPWQLTAGDLDADGDLDLAIAHNYSYDNNVSVLLGNGDGSFDSEPSTHTIACYPQSLVIGDVDTDGDLDLVVAGQGGNHGPPGGVFAVLGNGDGSFGPPVRVDDDPGARCVAVSDLNADGILDFISNGYSSVSILLAKRYTIFARELIANDDVRFPDLPLLDDPSSSALSDLNGDGYVDQVTTNYDGFISISLGVGDGTYAAAETYPVEMGTDSVVVRDFDGDGHYDLATVSRYGGVSLVRGIGDGTFAPTTVFYYAKWGFDSVQSGDLDGDGDPDLVLTGYDGVAVLRNDSEPILNPLPGDYDGNSVVDDDDRQVWRSMFGQMVARGGEADGNHNGMIDAADYVVWRDHYGERLDDVFVNPAPGDYDGDWDVDNDDRLVWRSTFGQYVEPGTGADGNLNGVIDAADYVVWRNNRGRRPGDVLISEIMYHPQGDNDQEEYIELYNARTEPVDLTGWRFTDGIDYAFPNMQLPAGEYLVVAADVAAFTAKYPGITNVVGGWEGQLSNRGEDIELEDAGGVLIDQVHYSDEGQWAVRVEGDLDHGHRGWEWQAEHDGDGNSLELANWVLPNEYGANWGPSQSVGGTPGRGNSLESFDVAPLVVDLAHWPAIPRSTETVFVTARILDEASTGVTATLHYREDDQRFQSVAMVDDGLHGDNLAGDGIYGAAIPPRPNNTVVEFYVEATDSGGLQSAWPAVVRNSVALRANLLYQVMDESPAHETWDPNSQPIDYLIMTELERAELADIGDGPLNEALSNAQMNGTLIHVSGTGVEVRYNVGIRNRGGASRVGPPNNYRVNVPHDRPVDGVSRFSVNAGQVYADILGSIIYQLAGLPAADASAVRVRVNGTDLAEPGGPRMYGSYSQIEVIDGQFSDNHFPDDRQGNLYGGFAAGGESGDLRYEGPDADAYRDTYSKETNAQEDDWSDLIHLTEVLNLAPDETLLDDLRGVVDVEQWMQFFALDSLLGNLEFSLNAGVGDNYWLYRGVEDPRFVIIPQDLDTILGRDRNAQPNRSIFVYTAVAGLSRLLTHPDTLPLYYQAYLDLIERVFNPTVLFPLFDQVLGGTLPATEIDKMKQFVVDRTAGVLAQIPQEFAISSSLPVVGGYYRTTQPVAELAGTANAVLTKSLLVNGQLASWSPFSREWSISSTGAGHTEVLVPTGSIWRYLDDGSDQGAAWRQTGFDDSAWKSGAAPLGYGNTGDATLINYGPNPANKFITTYFRQSFSVADASAISDLTLRLLRDDGAVVYLNGQEIIRSNLPDGNLDFQTVASTWIGGDLEDQVLSFAVDPSLLHDGTNLLTVEIHQRSAIDDDIRFDLSLEANVGVITGGVPLRPGINRVKVEAFDGPEGTGNLVDEGFVDIWYDGSIGMGGVPDPPPGQPAPPIISGGTLAADMYLAPTGPAYQITGDVIVPAGVTLTILPGTTVLFDVGSSLTIDGGRLVAEGLPYEQIRFTRLPGSTGSWDGIHFVNSQSDNRIAHAILEYGVSENGMIGLEESNLLIDTVDFDHTDKFRIHSLTSSLIVRNSTFRDVYGPLEQPTQDNKSEHIWGSGIADDGHFIIENNYFGTTKGHNDAVDFDSAARPGPIPVILNNVFAGSGDDALDLECDAHVEGNLFMNIVKDAFNTASGDANAISAGAGREYIVVRNIFATVDHAVQVKDDAFLTFVNNTVYQASISAIYFELVDRGPGRGALVEGSIFADTPVAFAAVRPTTDLTVNRSVLPPAALMYGTGNIAADPRLTDPDDGDFHLKIGSPALGTALGGLDMGALVAGGASISGEPPAVTSSTSATLHVFGPGITHYRYQVNGGPWSVETAVEVPIELMNLSDGDYVVSVVGKNSAGIWQEDAEAAVSRVWTVDTSSPLLRINEVLASNDAAVYVAGGYPDLIELYNFGAPTIDLSGMSLTDDPALPRKFVFPAGTTLAGGDYLVLVADQNGGSSGPLNVGFAVDADGEGVYLYDNLAQGGALVDSIEFGVQVTDLSISRNGHDSEWTLSTPTLGAPNVAQPLGDPATLVINEWMTAPQVRLKDDFVELFNQDPLPVALGGLYLTDDPVARPNRHQISPLSFIAGDGFAVFLADENVATGPNHIGFRLSAEHEMLGLFDDELLPIDQIVYYAQTTDVAQGRTPDGGNVYAVSVLPTPGVANPVFTESEANLISLGDVWAYNQSGNDLGTEWREPAFDDSAWLTGPGVFGVEDDVLPAPIQTSLTTGITTYYFRKHFTIDANVTDMMAELTTLIDDGAVVYINGLEVLRLGLPDGNIAFNTRANRGVGLAALEGPFAIPDGVLVAGDNAIAVEVHQVSPANPDVVFGLSLDARTTTTSNEVAQSLALLENLRITELMFNPSAGQDYEYIELANIGSDPLDLTGVRISGGVEFTFPVTMLAAGEYVVVASDLASFRSLYGNSINTAGQFDGQLSNGGESIELLLPAPYDAAILRFEYDDAWYPVTDGGGNSLVVVEENAEPSSWDGPANWRASRDAGGSPGHSEPPGVLGDINGDGTVDSKDYTSWRAAFGLPAIVNPAADLNGNGSIDAADYVFWRKHQTNAAALSAALDEDFIAGREDDTFGNADSAQLSTSMAGAEVKPIRHLNPYSVVRDRLLGQLRVTSSTTNRTVPGIENYRNERRSVAQQALLNLAALDRPRPVARSLIGVGKLPDTRSEVANVDAVGLAFEDLYGVESMWTAPLLHDCCDEPQTGR